MKSFDVERGKGFLCGVFFSGGLSNGLAMLIGTRHDVVGGIAFLCLASAGLAVHLTSLFRKAPQ